RMSFLFSLIVFLSVGIVFWCSLIFEKAEVLITPKTDLISLKDDFYKATKNSLVESPFEIMIIKDEKIENIKLSNVSEISTKAKGEIVLYNEYSQTGESLQSGTYLSDETGKVYLTDKAVVIPGFKIIEDGKKVPGEIKVSVSSFLPGESYNGNPSDFYVNAFKGTSKYEKIYGKAETEMTGGAQGVYYSFAEEDGDDLDKIANSALKNSLIRKVNSLIPSDYIFYPEASNFSYEIDINFLSKTPNGEITIYGSLEVVLFREKELNDVILEKILPETKKEELETISIHGVRDLLFGFVDENQNINKDLANFDFTLTGDVKLIWSPNILALKNNLLGVSKINLSHIFAKDVGISDASVKIFPPWKSTLPINESKIKIEVL
ncbi:MAG: hypothetical protein PHT84_01935, partial [Candidatus Pacebacteria bacterium]|nr:hypothetical protein [Candidatus Paceibacterota bacterium]